MAFFDELKKQMSGVAQSAQKVTEIARLQRQINLKQAEFDNLFKEIGQLYYTCHKRGEQPAEEMNSRCAKVDSLAAEIEGLKLKLDDIRQIRRCTACGSTQNNESKFCSNCGAKLEERVAPAEEETESPAVSVQEEEETASDVVRSVFINWPETSAKYEAPAEEEAEEESAEETENN